MGKKVTAAPTAAPVTTAPAALHDIGDLSRKYTLAGWERAGLVALRGWVAGKRVTEADFLAARDELHDRRAG